MKNSSKNNYSGNDRKQFKQKSNSNFFSKNTNSLNKNNRFSTSSSKNKSVNNMNEIGKNNFSSFKKRKPIDKSNFSDSNIRGWEQQINQLPNSKESACLVLRFAKAWDLDPSNIDFHGKPLSE